MPPVGRRCFRAPDPSAATNRDERAIAAAGCRDDDASVIKRMLAGPLWFFATWTLFEAVALMVGAPHSVGPIIGMVVAALVVLDPANLIWSPAAPRTMNAPAPNANLQALIRRAE